MKTSPHGAYYRYKNRSNIDELNKIRKGKSGIQKKWAVEMKKRSPGPAFSFRRIKWNEHREQIR